MFGSHKRLEKKLRKDGACAPATVLDVHRLAVEHIDGPNRVSSVVLLCRLKLRVEPPGESPFEIKTTARFPNRRKPAEGSQVQVLYDPHDHGKLVVDQPEPSPGGELAARMTAAQGALDAFKTASTPSSAPAGDSLDQLAKLGKLHATGALTDAEFAEQKQRILGES